MQVEWRITNWIKIIIITILSCNLPKKPHVRLLVGRSVDHNFLIRLGSYTSNAFIEALVLSNILIQNSFLPILLRWSFMQVRLAPIQMSISAIASSPPIVWKPVQHSTFLFKQQGDPIFLPAHERGVRGVYYFQTLIERSCLFLLWGFAIAAFSPTGQPKTVLKNRFSLLRIISWWSSKQIGSHSSYPTDNTFKIKKRIYVIEFEINMIVGNANFFISRFLRSIKKRKRVNKAAEMGTREQK